MSDHEHDWVFAYAALAANQTFTAHYDCRACASTRDVYGLSRADIARLRGPVSLLAIFPTPREQKRLAFWRWMVQERGHGANDQAPADPVAPALATFDALTLALC